MSAVGLDLGTFHTVAVEVDDDERVPPYSVRSIAIDKNPPPAFVGSEALENLSWARDGLGTLIVAPKLRLLEGNSQIRDRLALIIARLAEEAFRSLLRAGRPQSLAVTIPPGWEREHCDVMRAALQQVVPKGAFVLLHEPVALLIAGMWLSRKRQAPEALAALNGSMRTLVCDWGAGTVDLALVQVAGTYAQPELQCLSEHTNLVWGGTHIARRSLELARGSSPKEHEVLLLQQHWQGDTVQGLGFENVSDHAAGVRREAVEAIREIIVNLANHGGRPEDTLLVLHGGPLESPELAGLVRSAARDAGVTNHLGLGNAFASQVRKAESHLRRDALVALGAAVFAQIGEPRPEFSYRLELRDSSGLVHSAMTLKITEATQGILPIRPPYTGVDYYVGIAQMRGDQPTGIRADLGIFVSAGRILLYRIARADVGFVSISVEEATDEGVPKSFEKAGKAFVELPERSTRFILRFA